jgi:mitogen-activated protein kinase 1/3
VPEHYELIKKVGEGAYGVVASFKDNKTGKKVAVKKNGDAFADADDGKRILREIKLQRQLDHENILGIVDVFAPETLDFNDVYIVTELMEFDLAKVIASNGSLKAEHHQWFMQQILLGLAYLHSADIVHRDLKPANILTNKQCDVKICDFGLARVLNSAPVSEDQTNYVVTRWYRAPEVLFAPESHYTAAIDVWSAGCIMAEMIKRRPLFQGTSQWDQIKRIVALLGMPRKEDLSWLPEGGAGRRFINKHCKGATKVDWPATLRIDSEQACAVVDEALRFDPRKRKSARDILSMPYFASIAAEQDTKMCPRLDWSFDNFKPTRKLLQKHLYLECADFHPELYERDRAQLAAWGIRAAL